ncbi:helix-turn-helix transcriptional regulator [Paenibacillus amylolyticus]|uniref:helix-turn-helix transcriptional regulator n=1 Tax=Paenibacillus amylolyticus TaxID=1451 RepID=UPI00096E2E55|nr:AraC family transcriptional regulator [Paenibacillus amylolyticus]OMF40248.1 AraC family transcriptional regulator [Paenibacillus amylolyticus]
MNPIWHESSRASNLYFISGGHKPANPHQWGPGVRDVYALHYIIRGQGTLETGGRVFRLVTGESFIIFPQKEIYYYPDPQDPWEYVWVEFNGEDAGRLLGLTQLSEVQPVVTVSPETLQPFFHLAWNAGASSYELLRADARLRLLLSYYMEHYPKEPQVDAKDYVWLARKYIEQNYWKPTLTVTEIVKAVNLERSYLFRLFKAATGKSVLEYITHCRIERACELLKTSGLPIQSVAYSVGYNDPLYFSKVFKKSTSHTPTEYMTLHRTKV